MHNTVADCDVPAAEIGPRLFLQPGQQLEPDLAVCLVVLVDPSDHRGKLLDQIGAAHDAHKLAVLDDRHALDPLALEEGGDLR